MWGLSSKEKDENFCFVLYNIQLWARERHQENQMTLGKDLDQKELEQKNMGKRWMRVRLEMRRMKRKEGKRTACPG